MEYRFPTFKAAAVQAAPVYLDRDATTDKACSLIREAARNGARLVAFPEAYLPGYPHWVWLDSPERSERFFPQFVKSSVAIPSPVTDKLCAGARACQIYVVMGLNESSPHSFAEVFNSQLLVGPSGKIIGRHRKIMPTYAEKLHWSVGDGSSLRVYDTELGRLGMLICGENTNSLARFALFAQAEQVHVSSYPAFPRHKEYDAKREVRAASHSYEGKVFNIVSSSIIDADMKQVLADTPDKKEVLDGGVNVFTAIVGPDGRVLSGPLADEEEGIVYADVNLEDSIRPKLFHDIVGSYNRFDIFALMLCRAVRGPIRETGIEQPEAAGGRRMPARAVMERMREALGGLENETLRTELLGLLDSLDS